MENEIVLCFFLWKQNDFAAQTEIEFILIKVREFQESISQRQTIRLSSNILGEPKRISG